METLVSSNVATGSNAVSTTTMTTTAIAVEVAAAAAATTPAASSNKVAAYSMPASPSTPTSTSAPASPLPSLNQSRELRMNEQHLHHHHHHNHHHHHHLYHRNDRTPSPTTVSGVAHGNQYQHNTNALYTPIKSATNATSTTTPYHQQQQTTPLQQTNETTMLGNDSIVLHTLREKLRSPVSSQDLHSTLLELGYAKPPKIIKGRYLVSSHRYHMSAAAAAKTPASYRHLIDLTSSHLRCTDIFTGQQFLCKIINEPLYKVQRAYFQLLQIDSENCQSTIYGHALIRGTHDIVPLNAQRTYVIIAPPPQPTTTVTATTTYEDATNGCVMNEEQQQQQESSVSGNGVDYYYEDLHTYLRNKRRLCEPEARALFHQICQTVQVCHRNGVILRDLKLRRFHFIDEARTKLQYESLEGSMILDDPTDDTLREKIGCPLYTAPELLCPNATYRGKPADMWSLGVLLYTMLVGQYPFYEKANYCSLITVIRHCQVQIPSMLTRSVRWLLLALLRKNHEERMRAEHILFTPWLREQRPYYMYIPANVSIPMDDNDNDDMDDEEDIEDDIDDSEELIDECLLAEHECDSEVVMVADTTNYAAQRTRMTTGIIANSTTTTTTARETTTTNSVEPLDYTCATLQYVAHRTSAGDSHNQNENGNQNQNEPHHTETDVDMG